MVFLLTILVFIIACNLVMNSVVSAHPRLDFSTSSEEDMALASVAHGLDDFGGAAHNTADSATPSIGGWFNLNAMWAPMPITDGKRAMRFIVNDVDSEGTPQVSQN